MAFVGEVPWHGLGNRLTEDQPLEVWEQEAGMGWEAQEMPMFVTMGDQQVKVPGKKALVRSDNGAVLSVVSKDYKPVQPRAILSIMNEVALKSGLFKIETAGCLRGGRKIWALAKAVDDATLDMGGDVINRYFLLATSFDKSIKTIAQQTSIRVVCANTLGFANQAGESGSEKQLAWSHMEDFSADILKQRIVLDKQWQSFGHLVGLCIKVKLSDLGVKEFFRQALYPTEVLDEGRVSRETQVRNVDRLFTSYTDAPGQNLDTARGTLWGALNAVTHYVDHVAKARSTDLRLDKAWFGQGAHFKDRALSLAAALAN